MAEYHCSRCRETYDECFFGSNHARYASLARHRPICLGCEQTARDEQKRQDRWRDKAIHTRSAHARKLNLSTRQLEELGWDIGRMAHEAAHVYANGCPECGLPFDGMGHGYADITLDVIDRDAPAVYGRNTRWICMTDNRAKGKMPIGKIAAKHAEWQKWRNRQAFLLHDPYFGTMFQGQAAIGPAPTVLQGVPRVLTRIARRRP